MDLARPRLGLVSASAALGGDLSLSWLPPRVMPQKHDD